MKRTVILIFLACIYTLSSIGQEVKKKILFVVTSHEQLGKTGKKTGFYLSEVAHPYKIFTDQGYDIDFVSPQGGMPPIDGYDLTDSINKSFIEDKDIQNKLSHSLKPDEVVSTDYIAIFYAGGHGTMWDLPDNMDIASITTKIYEKGGTVGAVCHGPSGLLNVKLSNGQYLIAGKNVSGFTNDEEAAVKLTEVVPFLLEDELRRRKANVKTSANWQVHIESDQRVVTGQNPGSASAVANEMLKLF